MKSSIFGLAAATLACNVAAQATSGTFKVLTMNVAGLPAIFNGNDVPGDKATNAGTIGSLFAKYDYDVINVQEDFNYHAKIYATDNHPFRTPTSGPAGIGQGLNTLSNFSWINFSRTKWAKCSNASGADCLTPKGFTFMRILVSEGVTIDFYNLHADAGTEADDEKARTANIQEVADYINRWSVGNAVVVMGDTNSRYSRVLDNIRVFTAQNSLADAWVTIEHGGAVPPTGSVCENPSKDDTCETVDKVFFRGNGIINLSVTDFSYESNKFLQPNGDLLSDHNPISVAFSWSLSSTRRQSGFWGGPHGDWFNDLPLLPSNPKVSTLTFHGGSRLDSVGLTLANGATFFHGGSGGKVASMTLANNEFWTSAKLCSGQYNSRTRNFYIQATTSAGRTLAAGSTTKDCATFNAPAGWQIVGYLGQSGDNVDQLSFIYAPQ